MNTKFKRHQKVKLLLTPLEKDVEPYIEENPQIKKGMTGEINVILPNGQYHVLIKDKKGNKMAYVVMDEEAMEEAGPKPKKDKWDLDEVDKELIDIHHNKNN